MPPNHYRIPCTLNEFAELFAKNRQTHRGTEDRGIRSEH